MVALIVVHKNHVRYVVLDIVLYEPQYWSCSVFLLLHGFLVNDVNDRVILFQLIIYLMQPPVKFAEFQLDDVLEVVLGEVVEIYYLVQPVYELRTEFLFQFLLYDALGIHGVVTLEPYGL